MEVFMEIGYRIRKKRKEFSFSQEVLAERIFVTRQTISNWENDKSYPDINNLILLSQIFNTSIDNLIKGDIEKMEKIVNQEEVSKFNRLGSIYSIGLILTILLVSPAFYFGWVTIIAWVFFWIALIVIGVKLEKLKKLNDIHSLKEILEFQKGKKLDEIEKMQEKAKRPYQFWIILITLAVGSAAVSFIMNLLLNR